MRACGLASLSRGLLCVLGRIVLLSGGGAPPKLFGVRVCQSCCLCKFCKFIYIYFCLEYAYHQQQQQLITMAESKKKPAAKKKRKVNYKTEYRKYHSSDRMKKERALRNKNRRRLTREGRVKKGDGKHIDHKDGNPRNNGKGNLRVIDAKRNRKKQ